jgi:hypothetical protein
VVFLKYVTADFVGSTVTVVNGTSSVSGSETIVTYNSSGTFTIA